MRFFPLTKPGQKAAVIVLQMPARRKGEPTEYLFSLETQGKTIKTPLIQSSSFLYKSPSHRLLSTVKTDFEARTWSPEEQLVLDEWMPCIDALIESEQAEPTKKHINVAISESLFDKLLVAVPGEVQPNELCLVLNGEGKYELKELDR